MEDWLYYPETCEITFTCDFLVGPRIDQDLCSLPTVSYFDAEYGDWYFDSTDMNEWPPGDYYFWITGTVGALSEGYELHFRLGNPCTVAYFTFESFPFSDTTYELGSPEIVQPWTDADLFSVELEPGFVPSDCGNLVVDFFDVNTGWYFDTYFFSQENNEFKLLQHNDKSLLGEYHVGVWVYFEDYSDNYGESTESFRVRITEVNCDAAVVSSSVMVD